MTLTCTPTRIPDVLIVEHPVHEDSRGFFTETHHTKKLAEKGIEQAFVQDNLSFSVRGVLRGLHYQLKKPQAKLVFVIAGEVFDVAVDIRRGSPSFGAWVGVHLSETNRRQLLVPEGFAHGFAVLSEAAYFYYKCTEHYQPGDEYTISWSDPSLNIQWPVATPILSEKDRSAPCLHEMPQSKLPVY